MRILKQSILMLLLSMVALTGCKKDDDGGEAGPAAEGTITASVNGTTITTVSMTTTANKITVGSTSTLTIQGNTAGTSSQAFMFIINGLDGVGTYEIGGSSLIATSASFTDIKVNLSDPTKSETNTWQAPYDDTVAGEIKISELTDKKVAGTFQFKGKNSKDGSFKEVKSGSFNVKIGL